MPFAWSRPRCHAPRCARLTVTSFMAAATRSQFPQDAAWQLVALSGDCRHMALTCRRSIVVFACNVSAVAPNLLPCCPPLPPPLSFSPHALLQISAAMPSITRLFACEIAEAPSSIVFVGQSLVFVGDCQGSIHALELASQSKTHEILPSAALRAAVVHMSSSRTPRPLPLAACPSLFDAPCTGDGQFVAAYDAAQRLHCINAETNHVIALDPVAGTPTALCWHPRESLLAVSLLGTKALRPHICAPALLFLGIS